MEPTIAWTDAARRDYERRGKRYSSDLIDREWALIAPFLPEPRPIGRPRTTDLRKVVNAIMYLASSGCAWSLLPQDFPPFTTVQRYFNDWRDRGLLRRISGQLSMAARELEGREASPTTGVIEGQSFKTTESGGIGGFDAGKRVKGRKRHIVTDTLGLMVGLVVHGADVQGRDGAVPVLASIRHRYPWLRHVFADGGYACEKLKRQLCKIGQRTIQIIEAFRSRQEIRDPAATMGGGADLRLARPLPQAGQRLREDRRKRRGLDLVAKLRLLTQRLARYCYTS